MTKINRIAIIVAASMLSSIAAAAIQIPPTPAPRGDGHSNFVPIEQAQRRFVFGMDRQADTADGRTLICPMQYTAVTDSKKALCYDGKDPAMTNRWIYLDDLKIPGFEQSGLSYVWAGYNNSSRILIVYFRKEGAK